MYRVQDLYNDYQGVLKLKLVGGQKGLSRVIKVPEAQRPGLSLSGFLNGYIPQRVLVFGKAELEYLKELSREDRIFRLKQLITNETPIIIIARRYLPPKELKNLAESLGIALFRTEISTMGVLSKLFVILSEEFAPTVSCHGTLVEVFDIGILIQGSSAVGKSETALGLVQRGHRLVADDVVRVKKRETGLEGKGPELTNHMLEIRGIGILNVALLYGAGSVRKSKRIDIVVHLETWNDKHTYDRIGLEEKLCHILKYPLPFLVLPVKPGRDVVLMMETIALNQRLKQMGFNSAQQFRDRLHAAIAKKTEKSREKKISVKTSRKK